MLSKLHATKYSDWNVYRCGSLISTIYLASIQQDTTLVVHNSSFCDKHIAIVLFSLVSSNFTLLVLDKLPVLNSPDVSELSSFYDKLKRDGEPTRLTDVLVSKFSVPLVLIEFFSIGSIDMLLVVDSLGLCYVWQFLLSHSTWFMVYNFSLITRSGADSDETEQKEVVSSSFSLESNVLVWHEKCTDVNGLYKSSLKYCYLTFGPADVNKALGDPSAFDIPPSMSQPITVLALGSIHSFLLNSDGKSCWIVENDATIFFYDFRQCQMLSTLACTALNSSSSSSISRFMCAIFSCKGEDAKCSNTLYLLSDGGDIRTVIFCGSHLKVVSQALPLELKKQMTARASKLNAGNGSINVQDFSVVCEDCSVSSGVVKVNVAYFAISAPGHCYLLRHTHRPLAITPDEMFSSDFWQQSSGGQPTVNYRAMMLFEEHVNNGKFRDITLPLGGKSKRGPFQGGHSVLSVDNTHPFRLSLTPLLPPDLTNRILFDDQNVAPDDESSGYSTVLLLLRAPSSMLQVNCQFLVNAKSSTIKSQGLLSLQQHQLWDLVINPHQADHELSSSAWLTSSINNSNEDASDTAPLTENQNILNVVMDKAFPAPVAPSPMNINIASKEKVDENADVLGEVPLSFKGNPWGSVRFAEDVATKLAAGIDKNKASWSPSRLVNSKLHASKPSTAFSLQGMPQSSPVISPKGQYGAPPEVSADVRASETSRSGSSRAIPTGSVFTFEPGQTGSVISEAVDHSSPSVHYTEYLLQRMMEPAEEQAAELAPALINVDDLLEGCMKEYEDKLRVINISAVVREKAKKRLSSASSLTTNSSSDVLHRDSMRAIEEQKNVELNRLIEKYMDEGVQPSVVTVNDPKKRLRTTDAMLISACYQVHWDDIKSFFDHLHQSSVGEDESRLLEDINNTPLHWMDCLDLVSLSPANSILLSDFPADNEVNIYQVVDPFKLLEIVSTLNPARRALYRSEPSAHLIDFTSPVYAVEQMVRQLLFTHPTEMFAVLLHLRRVEREFKVNFETKQAARRLRQDKAAAAASLLPQSPNVSLMDTDGYYSTFYGSLFREVNAEESSAGAAAPRLSLPSESHTSSASVASEAVKASQSFNSAESDNEEEEEQDEEDGGEEYSFFKTVGGSGSDSEEDVERLATIDEQDEEHESEGEAEQHRLDTPLIPLKQVASDIDVLGTLSDLELQQRLNQKEKRINRFSGMHSAMSSAESSPVRSLETKEVMSLLAGASASEDGEIPITDELLVDAIARDRHSFPNSFPGFEDELSREEAELDEAYEQQQEEEEEDDSDSEEFSFFRTVGTDSDSLLDGTDAEDEEDLVGPDGISWMATADDGREYVPLVDRLHTVCAAIVFFNTKPLHNWDILSHYASLSPAQQDCLLKVLLMCGDTTLAVEAMFCWNRLYLLTLYMIRLAASANYVAQHIDMNAHTEQGLFQANGITRNVNKDESDIFSDEYYHTGRGRLNRPESFPSNLSPASPFVRAKTPDWSKVGNGWDIEFEEHLDSDRRLLDQQQQSPSGGMGAEKELSFAERRMLEAVQLFKRVFLFCLQRNSLECAREIVKYKPKWVQEKVVVTLFRLFASSQYASASPMVKDESSLQKILGKK